jgi:molecular chaperone DnaK (HSP70)
MGKAQVVTFSGTVTPTVTVSRIGTFFTTVTPSPLPTEVIPEVMVTAEPQKTSVPIAKKTTYSPVSPLTALAGIFVVCGFMLAKNRIRK